MTLFERKLSGPGVKSPAYLVLDGKVSKVSEKAICVQMVAQADNYKKNYWMPRSAVMNGQAMKVGDGPIWVAEWFAFKESLPCRLANTEVTQQAGGK